MNAVDTNILVYAVDRHDDAKRVRVLDLLEGLSGEDTRMPWQVACEFGAVLQRMARDGRFVGDYGATVSSMRNRFPVVLPRFEVLERALKIQLQAQVSSWDALLIAACADAGIARLYTEDIQSRPEIEGVKLVSPFA